MTAELVYLDHSATTPVDKRVLAAMQPFFAEDYGNPSSLHRFGQKAEAALEESRRLVAQIFGCPEGSIFFTSCATESNNIVLKGFAEARRRNRTPCHVLSTTVEHPSVLNPLHSLQDRGRATHAFLPVDRGGRLLMEDFSAALTGEAALVSIIFGNNEIGTINPIQAVGEHLLDQPALLHTDAVQCANFLELNVEALHVDFLSLSAHKFYGPKGIGLLYARYPALLEPLMQGGSQEAGMRPGTNNVPLIVGAAKALELAQESCESETKRLVPIRDAIIQGVLERITDAELTGDREHRLPHHASFAFTGLDSNELLASLDLAGFACSSGSACKVGNPEPSEVLLSLGYPDEVARGALRITLGRSSTLQHGEALVDTLTDVVERLRCRENT